MTNIDQYRETADLVRMIADLTQRVRTLEKARSLGNASIDGGELTVKGGDVVVRNANNEEVLRLQHGSMPSIKMYPDSGLDDYYAQMFAWESGAGATFEAGIKTSAGVQAGGKLLLQRGATYLSHQPLDTGAEETYLSLSENSGAQNHFRFVGKFCVDQQFSATDAWVIGQTVVDAGFGAVGISFDYPLDTTPLVMYTITGATATFDHCLVSTSSTGFTVGWSGTAAHTINWIAFRR